MDKRRIKSGKEKIQNNERHKEAEMFVLTPDILEKLGINLGQFTSPLPHPGTHDPEASKAKHNIDEASVSNSTVNNGDLTTKSKRKAAKAFVSTDLPNADDNVNKSDEFDRDPSELQKLLQSEATFINTSLTRASNDRGTSNTYSSMSVSETSQVNSSSFLETASLMKKSVLLSPTFCNTDFNPNTCDQMSETTQPSVVPVTLICTKNVSKSLETPTTVNDQSPSYVEVWTTNVNIDNEMNGVNNDSDNVTSMHESDTAEIDSAIWKTKYPETFAALSGPSKDKNNVNTIDSTESNIKTNKIVEEFAFSAKYHESNINNNCINSTVSSDCDDSQISAISTMGDYLDEIHLSDASNQENKTKIKIISEKILNSVQLKQIQNACASHKSNFTPVSIVTLVKKTSESGELINNSSLYTETEIRKTGSEFNDLNGKDESNDMKVPLNLTESTAGKKLSIPDGNLNKVKQQLQNNNTILNDLIRESKQTIQSTENRKTYSSNEKGINESIPDINSSGKDNADHSNKNKSTVDEDKVKEIATYLVQLLNDRKNKQHKKLESHKRIYKCYKRNPHKAKLVTQGVEKPGGKNEKMMDSVNETKLLLQEPLNCVSMDSWISTDDIICIGTTSETHELTQKLCVCVEFGKLDYNNWDNYYENIHFWHHKKDVCEPELCYSIYYDGEVTCQPVDDIQILDGLRVSTSGILTDNLKSVENSEVISEDALSSNTSVNISVAIKPGKRGRPKKNTTYDKVDYDGEVNCQPANDIQILDRQQVSASDILADNSKSVEKSEVISEDALSPKTPIAIKPGKHGRPKINTINDKVDYDGEVNCQPANDIQILDRQQVSASDILADNSKSVEKSEVISEDALSPKTPSAIKPGKRGRPKKNTTNDKVDYDGEVNCQPANDIQILDRQQVSASDMTDNSKTVTKYEVISKDELCSNTPVNTPIAIKPGKRGRPKKNITNDKTETLDESDIVINNSETSSTPASINTSVAEQPTKRGRGRPKKISTQIKTDSTINNRNSYNTNQHNTKTEPSKRLSSASSSDEPLIYRKRGEISSTPKSSVKNEQTDNVLSESEVSYNVDGVANSSISNYDSKCAICKEEVTNKNWIEHSKIHNYLAWRDTESPLDLDDEHEVVRHLTIISNEKGILTCSKCQKQYKTPKSYYGHIQTCDGGALKMNISTASDLNTIQESLTEEKTRKRRKRTTVDEIVECGVCKESVKNVDWIEHIRLKHNYMAKRAGEIPLDENNEEQVQEHLYNICKYHDGLICNKCGLKRRYLKSYLTHMVTCNNPVKVKEPEIVTVDIDCNDIVKCGVCKLDVYRKLWIEHMQKAHKYFAWIEGEPPLDLDNPQQVHDHLQSIVKTAGFLRCWVCSETRKYTKLFLQHVKLCESSGFEKVEPLEKDPNIGEDKFECGVCHEIGFMNQWKEHAMSKHYNIAWMTGQMPINLKNPYAVEKYLKEYKIRKDLTTLVCKICGESRVSCYGFYAHIIICGKTEAELEELQNVCEICNKKYVCVYKNQHMAYHRDSELRKEKRERDAALSLERSQRELDECIEPGRKRMAAERASKVIQNLKEEEDEEPPAKRIRCDSEDSVKLENEGESSDDNEFDSDGSVEDLEVIEPTRERDNRKRTHHAPKIRRLPFKVDRFSSYVHKSYKDFCAYHFTDDCLFNDWRHKDLQLVSESITEYLPSVTESCLLKYGDNKWTSYKRFEAAKIGRGFILYTGGCIQCLSWAPQSSNTKEDFYFAVLTHEGPDVPRFDKDSTPVHPGFIQIWGLTDFGAIPKLSLGIIHDYGTIWAMDWCPSGARDVLPKSGENFTKYRLGLLAIACSNGFAYVLSVPYPNANQSEMTICKATAVAELRLNMMSNKEIYQATSITWSTQKGHSVIVVGYADGTTALYDLSTKSPLLTKKENNMTILYPFQNKRTENGPISGVSVTATMERSRAVGGVCAAGVGGAGAWGARRGITLRAPLPATGVGSTPHWPSYLLYAELAVSSKVVNDLEWLSGGRRAGGACAGGVCARCACAVLSAPPALRLVRAHPCYPEPRRPLTLATLRMIPLHEKPRIKKDDLSMVIEPLTYEDTVSKYGLELRMTVKDKNQPKSSNEPEQRPERFPLSDVTAISFCPSDRHHNRVAIASHSGLVFILCAPD